MKKAFIPFLGVIAFLSALTLNFRYALNDYGILENTLGGQVLAQNTPSTSSNSSSSGGGISNPWFWRHERTTTKCTGTISYSASASIPFFSSSYSSSATFTGTLYTCQDGWSLFSCMATCNPN
ncbi:MAG: hypothetical protein LUH10_07610 [Tannerellaceae bacterium]|nr:hypothetical protein [Tannerellaceae bacterium]